MGKKKVFIGVGHGGSDPGTVGYLVEKDINLMMATVCRDFLTAYGVGVKMSRTKDEDGTVRQEVEECNAYAPDLAIDVHNNSGGGDDFEVFHTIGGDMGKTLVQNIEKHVKAMGQNSRGVKTCQGTSGNYYAFIRETKAPAVIVESVFVDIKADAAQADALAEQQAFGVAYAKGILDTLGLSYDKPEEESAEPEQPAKEHWAQPYYDSLIAKGGASTKEGLMIQSPGGGVGAVGSYCRVTAINFEMRRSGAYALDLHYLLLLYTTKSRTAVLHCARV